MWLVLNITREHIKIMCVQLTHRTILYTKQDTGKTRSTHLQIATQFDLAILHEK